MDALKRQEINPNNCWKLDSLYADFDAWRTDYNIVKDELPKIASYKGKLADSPDSLLCGLTLFLTTKRSIEKLFTYAQLKSDEDTSNSTCLGHLQEAKSLYTQFATVSSFLAPELIEMNSTQLNTLLENENLSSLSRFVRDIVRFKPHTLSFNEEQILAQGLEVFSACGQTFSQLNNADLNFGTINVEDKTIPLTHGSFTHLLRNPDRQVRAQAFEQFYSVIDAHKHTLSSLLAGSVKSDMFLSKTRSYTSCIERALFADNITSLVYDNLINSIHDGLNTLHKYYELRKAILQVDELHIYDTYTPLVSKPNIKIPYEHACELVLKAVAPLGNEYVETLRSGLSHLRWVDIYENKGKRSGAYSSGCYDSHPYILLNYKEESLDDVFTLAHEAGHSMHSFLSRRSQPYQDHDYTIFVAEVASTLNEQLLLRELKNHFKDNAEMQIYLINHELDAIKATFFRQTMFAEFEKKIHDLAENNKSLTVDTFRDIYSSLLKSYFGEAVSLSELDYLECFRIPHFYSAFYVYKYATGLSAAISLANQIINDGNKARARYLNFLSSGCSKYPLELLRDAGVDLAHKNSIDLTTKQFSSLLEELA